MDNSNTIKLPVSAVVNRSTGEMVYTYKTFQVDTLCEFFLRMAQKGLRKEELEKRIGRRSAG